MKTFVYKLENDEQIYTKEAENITSFLDKFKSNVVYSLEKVAELQLVTDDRSIEIISVDVDGTVFSWAMMPISLIPVEDLKERIG